VSRSPDHRVRLRDPEVGVVALLTGAFVLLGAALSLLVPMFGNFDEQTHLDRARYSARHPVEDVGPELRRTSGSWAASVAVDAARVSPPSDPAAYRGTYAPFRDYPGGNRQQRADCPGLCQNIQYVHPPGWYLLVAPVTGVLEDRPFPHMVLALRLLDVLLVAPMVALAWATAREVWPRSPRRRLAVTALVAMCAPLAYTASAVNNDALLLLAAGTAIYLGTRVLRRGPTPWLAAALGAAVTVGLLTKVQMVLMAPALGLMVLAGPVVHRSQRVRSAAAFAVAAAPGALWWLVSVLDSNPLAPKGTELLSAPAEGPWNDESYLTYAVAKVPQLLGRFWGTYDSPVTFVPDTVRLMLGLAVALLALGWLVARPWARPDVEQLRWLLLAAVPASLVAGVLQASVSAYRRSGELRALAPRYLYPAAAVLAIAAVAAAITILRRLDRPAPRGALLLTMALAAVAAVASVAHVARSAYGTGSPSEVLDAARGVSPIGRPAPALAAVALLWLGTVVLALRGARDLSVRSAPRDGKARGPTWGRSGPQN